jgi:hypothetical protein
MAEAQTMTVSPGTEPRVVNNGERGGITRVNPLLQISPTRPTSVAAALALRERGVDVTEEARALSGTEKLRTYP